ncbi:sigma-70 family RNA polymerase sigma factor [Seonamhaeicola marinus]|uniref:Sigma-70 family RNA polymerase sigma factor n=1 Tax=Seonamhaeicola marinus TaxID=1912246 RepID=A0A5D0IME6_9FLAO|nr:sigma-70 family RNA polymerase sigma factor [Seonamhaeicola marinus]TYA84090.1 sigma-70 family RNA polymerase sigma factor [Seonamhaeicola marinus]
MENYQKKLFPYAYNILGSVDDAKDIVQDVIVKSLSLQEKDIQNKTGYLIRSVINSAINLKRKRNKNTRYGIWLPEPISTENADKDISKTEALSYSLLILLEKLNAKERAVFILKNGFDYSHKEIADIFKISIENSRKLLSRAKQKLETQNINRDANVIPDYTNFMGNYIEIIKNGDAKKLEQLLSKDVSLVADGGASIKVVKKQTLGKKETSDLLFYVFKTFQSKQRIKVSRINFQPALLFYSGNKLVACQVFEIQNQVIKNIYAILDPEKIKRIS